MASFIASNFQRYFLLERPVAPQGTKLVSDLETSLSMRRSISRLKDYEFTRAEICHYGFLATVLTFAFVIAPAPILGKLVVACAFGALLLTPLTSQFFLNALPILTWLSLFFASGSLLPDVRPPILVQTLPAVETIFYGDNLSDVLATTTHPVLDILAWLPYGIIHFAVPFVLAGLLFLFGPPTAVRAFAFAFGYMNLFGVFGQILFPAAPPWYKILHGLEPANYGMGGSPGGLARIDSLLGIDMYTSGFTNAPVPFGAFPSLHSGCAVMETLFLVYLFPRFKAVWYGYTLWLWWCTMYLTHHYFIDLTAGAALTYVIFTYTKYTHLPVCDQSKFCRWSYLEITMPDTSATDPLVGGYEPVHDLEAGPEFEMESLRNSVLLLRLLVGLGSPRQVRVTTNFDDVILGPASAILSIYEVPEESVGTLPAVSVFDTQADSASIALSKTSMDGFERGFGKRD